MSTQKAIMNALKGVKALMEAPEKNIDLEYLGIAPAQEAKEEFEYSCGAVACCAGAIAASEHFPEYSLRIYNEEAFEGAEDGHYLPYWKEGKDWLSLYELQSDLFGNVPEAAGVFHARGGKPDAKFFAVRDTWGHAVDYAGDALDGKPISDRTLAIARLLWIALHPMGYGPEYVLEQARMRAGEFV